MKTTTYILITRILQYLVTSFTVALLRSITKTLVYTK